MTTCVFPGSFDPVTKGHENLISRAASLFDHVTVTVMVNIRKPGFLSTETRLELLSRICRPYQNVTVDSWDGLLADYMKKRNERIVIRGLRSGTELAQEMQAADANRLLDPGLETIFLPSDPQLSAVSSSAVREIVSFGGKIEMFVPDGLAEEIRALLSKKRT